MARVLIIDDEGTVRRVLARLLERRGYTAETAGDGLEAMRILSERSFDLVITDLCMPNQEGLETIHQIRKDHPETIIFAASGMGDSDLYLELARKFGADQVFAKPMDLALLRKKVDEAIAARDSAEGP